MNDESIGATEEWSPLDEVKASTPQIDSEGFWSVIHGAEVRECSSLADVFDALSEWRDSIKAHAEHGGFTSVHIYWYSGR